MAQILATTPYWIRTAPLPTFPSLDRDVSVDVAIVGGGLVGVTAAYLLKSAGLKVAVIERDGYAEADTGHTTSHLTMVTDEPLSELVDKFGRSTAAAVWQAGRLAIDRIELNVDIEDIDCGFERVPGFLHAAWEGPGMSKDQLRSQAATAVELGFPAEYVDHIRPFGVPGARFDQQAQFHPRRYLAGLLRGLRGDGSHVFGQTNVDSIADDGTVKAGSHAVTCGYVIIATHVPLMGKTGLLSATVLQSKLALYSTYALGGRLPAEEVPHGLYWDTAKPYHYLRVHRDGFNDYAIFGGADHKTGQKTDTSECWASLARLTRGIMPNLRTDRSVVRSGRRDQRRSPVHRRDSRSAIRRHRFCRQRHHVRDLCRDDGARLRPRPEEPVARHLRSAPNERPRRRLGLRQGEQGLRLLHGA